MGNNNSQMPACPTGLQASCDKFGTQVIVDHVKNICKNPVARGTGTSEAMCLHNRGVSLMNLAEESPLENMFDMAAYIRNICNNGGAATGESVAQCITHHGGLQMIMLI